MKNRLKIFNAHAHFPVSIHGLVNVNDLHNVNDQHNVNDSEIIFSACAFAAVSACRAYEFPLLRVLMAYEKKDHLFSVGIHPWDANQAFEPLLEELETMVAENPNLIIGETGLDFSGGMPMAEPQEKLFTAQLRLAVKYSRPVCIHCVHAWQDLLRILKNPGFKNLQFMIHSFSGSCELALQLIKRGAYISFSPKMIKAALAGSKKSDNKVLRAFKNIPENRILLETDRPVTDCSAQFIDFARACSEYKGMDLNDFAEIINFNSMNFFKIKPSNESGESGKTLGHEPVWHERTLRLLGTKGIGNLKKSTVMIAGLGAVGGFALEGLVRAGIGRFIIVDFDRVDITNINRQILADITSLGLNKTDLAYSRIKNINPECRVLKYNLFLNESTIRKILCHKPDIIIDAIDSVNSKTSLIQEAYAQGIFCLSSMGAALRFDPGAVKSGPLKEIKNDRLARIIRRRLRKRGVSDEHLCVYSTEDQDAARLKMQVNSDTAGLKKIQKSNALFNRGRDREIIGSLPTIPAIFGMFLANIAILKLSEK